MYSTGTWPAIRLAALTAALVTACALTAAGDYDEGKRTWDAGKPVEALTQWRVAASAGDRRAMLALGRLYLKGLGAPQDYVLAHMWFNLAASRGEMTALKERDALAAKMTPAQRAEAQKRAREWRPGRGVAGGAKLFPTRPSATSPPPARAIREAQELLAALGYKPGPADGRWGARSAKAYVAFLRDAGLPPGDTLTPAGLRAMRSIAKRQKEGRSAGATGPAGPGRPSAWSVGKTFRDCPGCPEMVVIPSGTFAMGSPADEKGRPGVEKPRHAVRIKKFAVGKYEVTRDEFGLFVSETGHKPVASCWALDGKDLKEDRDLSWHNVGYSQTGRDPVACVSWDDMKAYVEWLSGKTEKVYRLPSESEWEYVVRAGTRTRRYWGEDPRDTDICRHANGAGSETSFEWSNKACSDGYERTSPVGSFVSNGWGVHDMFGNVGEWVEDCWHEDYSGAPSDGSAWTAGADCRLRVLRGSAWASGPGAHRSTDRTKAPTWAGFHVVGFRIARTLTP